MRNRETRAFVAAVQALIGFEWLVSGANKVFSGVFPQGLAAALQDGLSDNPNAWYAALLRRAVLPHSVFFGYLIESVELALGVVLAGGAVMLLMRPRKPGEPLYRFTLLQTALAAGAALLGTFLCVNFHFWMGDGIVPTLNTAHPFDEGIDLDTLLPPLSLIVAYANIRWLGQLSGVPIFARIQRSWRAAGARLAVAFSAARQRRPASAVTPSEQ